MRGNTRLLWVFLVVASSTTVHASRTLPRSQWITQENTQEAVVFDEGIIKNCFDQDSEEDKEIVVSKPQVFFSGLDDTRQDDD